MNTNSNTYTIIYSTVMVVIVAAVLAYVSVSLSGKQQANVNTETRQSILSSVNLGQGADEASDKNAYVEQEFNKYITDSYLVDAQGNKVEGDAFSLALTAGLKSQYDIMKQANPDVSKLTLPVFVCTLDDGSKVEIFPIYGAGLWGRDSRSGRRDSHTYVQRPVHRQVHLRRKQPGIRDSSQGRRTRRLRP